MTPMYEFLLLLFVVVVPLAVCATAAAWYFVWLYRGHGVRLPLVLAIVNTLALFPAVLLAWLAYRARIGLPRIAEIQDLVALSILVLDLIPVITTGYLVWAHLRRDRRRR